MQDEWNKARWDARPRRRQYNNSVSQTMEQENEEFREAHTACLEEFNSQGQIPPGLLIVSCNHGRIIGDCYIFIKLILYCIYMKLTFSFT